MSGDFSKTPSFRNTDPRDNINRVSAQLVVFPNAMQAYQSGSCCRIAKNLYLTAAHVVTDWLEKFDTSAEIWAIHADEGPKYSVWSSDLAWLHPTSDLALLHTRPYNDTAMQETDWPSVAIDLAPPSIGDRIVGFGRHSPEQNITIGQDGTRHIFAKALGAATVGEVRDVHHERRDLVRLNFPCFQVNARFDGGMSGGPLFNEAGHLCGIICSNLEPETEDQEHVSYATTLWPLMGMPITIAPDGSETQAYPVLDLAQKGLICAIGHERVQVIRGASGELLSVQFRKV